MGNGFREIPGCTGSSVLLYIIIVVGTIFNFLPAGIGLFSTVLPDIFNQPIWFAVGAVATVIALFNLYHVVQLPTKQAKAGENPLIW